MEIFEGEFQLCKNLTLSAGDALDTHFQQKFSGKADKANLCLAMSCAHRQVTPFWHRYKKVWSILHAENP
jgi:hypothetical protein